MKSSIAAVMIAATATLALTQRDAVSSLAIGAVAPATSTDAAVRASLDEKVPGWLKTYGVPSVSIAVIRDGALAWTAAYGEAAPGKPATVTTLYNIASMTKPISAETILRLASEGKLGLDEPMWPHWVDPDIKNDPRHKLLTPRLSLLHRTGFPNWRRQTDKVLKFTFDPGTKSSYSGEGYEYMARFAEKKLGQPFDTLAATRIFEPLGLKDTSYRRQDWFAGRVAHPFTDGKYAEPDFADTWFASDFVYTTAADYAKFMISVMNNEKVSPEIAAQRTAIIDDQTSEVCIEGGLTREQCPKRLGFALGWAAFEYPNETVVTHGGADTGVKTVGFFVPQKRFGVVIFTNGEAGSKIIRDVARELYANEAFVAFLALQAR